MEDFVIDERISPLQAIPLISFSVQKREGVIRGRSTPSDARSIYESAQHWLQRYFASGAKAFTLHIDLYYINTALSVKLYDIINFMKRRRDLGDMVEVVWHYEMDDEQLLDVIEFAEAMTGFSITRQQKNVA